MKIYLFSPKIISPFYFFLKKYNKELIILVILFGCLGLVSEGKASCPPGPNLNVPAGTTLTIDNVGPCHYANVTIEGVVTTPVGKKLELTVDDTLIIKSGGKIDVTGKGNDTRGKGGDGSSDDVQCSGVHASGGGGGGYGAKGGDGGRDSDNPGGKGGDTYGDPDNPVDLGSKGGDGGAADWGGGYGGLGGGAVIIKAKRVIIESGAYIFANGEKGGRGGAAGGCDCPPKRDGTGGGGGGSGGTVNIETEKFIFNGKITANGGDGGDEWNSGGWDGSGGGGGGGRIRIYYTERTGNGEIEAKGGKPGELKCGVGIPGGAGEGTVGTIANPCTLGTLTCPDRCLSDVKREYGGTCDVFLGKCVYSGVEECTTLSGNPCLIDKCVNGECKDTNLNICGGLVPCNRRYDDPTTSIHENSPCTLCHFFVLAKRVIDFIFKFFILPLTLLMLVISGVKFIGASGKPEKIQKVKVILFATLVGVFIAFSAWLIVNFLLSFIIKGGFTPSAIPKILGQPWNKIECPVP